jgi:hypothetical protein
MLKMSLNRKKQILNHLEKDKNPRAVAPKTTLQQKTAQKKE